MLQAEYILEYEQRPWTTNAERASNRWKRAEFVREWRNAFKILAQKAQIPPCDYLDVIAEPFQKSGRLQDTAACNPAVKAAIDGLVDAGILPDDSGQYVRTITFLPAQRGRNALKLHLYTTKAESNDSQ